MIPKYPFEVILFPRDQGNRPTRKVCETLELALAIKNENVGRRTWRKIVVVMVLDETESTWRDRERER